MPIFRLIKKIVDMRKAFKDYFMYCLAVDQHVTMVKVSRVNVLRIKPDSSLCDSGCCPCPAHLSAGEDVSGQFDLGEVALPDGFEQPVVADVRLLLLLGAAGSHAGPARARADLLTAITVRRVLCGGRGEKKTLC